MAKPQSSNIAIGNFVLDNDAEYDYTVYPFVPGAKGKRIKLKIGARFKHVSAERRIEIMEEHRAMLKERQRLQGLNGDTELDEEELEIVKTVLSFEGLLLKEVLINFSHVVDKDGKEVTCTPESKAALISNSWARSALARGFFQSLESREDSGN